MSKNQIKWCQAHDWFISSNGESVTVRDDCLEGFTLTFNNFAKVYLWAGY